MENDVVAADQNAIKQLPPNIAKLPKSEKKAWARKLLPLISDNKVIAMACFLPPKTIAGMRGFQEGKTSPPENPVKKLTRVKTKTAGTGNGSKEAKDGVAAGGDIVEQVTQRVMDAISPELKKMNATIEKALTSPEGNGGEPKLTEEHPLIMKLASSQMNIAVSPLSQFYFAMTVEAAERNGDSAPNMSEFVNRTIESWFKGRGYHIGIVRRQDVIFEEARPT